MSHLCLLSAGSNAQGQLGTGSSEDAHVFTPCIFAGHPPGTLPPGTTTVSQIACGANHTLALLVRSGDMELWGCGDGRRGQLGPSYAAAVGAGSTAEFRKLDLQLRLHARSREGYTPRLVAAGWETSYIILSRAGRSDVLVAMGADDFGNLGVGGAKGKGVAGKPLHIVELEQLLVDTLASSDDGSVILTVENLATGPHHIVLKYKYQLQAGITRELIAGWGTSRHGQLGNVDSTSGRPSPFYSTPHLVISRRSACGTVTSCAAGTQHTVFLHSSGRLLGIGSNKKAQLQDLEKLTNVCAVGCTWNGTYAVVHDDDGYRIMATGSNDKGQLGRPRAEDVPVLAPVRLRFAPSMHHLFKVACGSEHVLCLFAITSANQNGRRTGSHLRADPDSAEVQYEVWAWGWNEHGNLGVGLAEDIDLPMKVWPPAYAIEHDGRAVDIWCGNGTSWIMIDRRNTLH
ncbi:hypothetical protein AcV7_001395 [Taiwanofungus camphoratus]|nr:hypothetical protein AcV7_001395 [Antrodia cinnamomea]